MLIGILGSGALLKLIRTPDEVFADSKLYLDIYAWGLPFVFYYNIATGIFSALGDSKTPFYFLAASSTSNIAVDIWFVKGFNMGCCRCCMGNLPLSGYQLYPCNGSYLPQTCKDRRKRKSTIFR